MRLNFHFFKVENSKLMLYNYLKVTIRNIWRSRINSVINILGLALGIACAILIVLFIKDEITFDKFHSKIDRLYRVTTSISRDEEEHWEGMTPFVLGLTVKDEIQDIEAATILTSYSDLVQHGETQFRETVTIVSPDFFKMFDFKVLDGATGQALSKISDVVLTREMAEKYFGRLNVTGETIRINAGGELRDYLVTAVLDNTPSNSSIQFDFLVNDENLKYQFAEDQLNHWFMIAGEVYVLLREGVSADNVSTKFPDMVKKGIGVERFEQINYKNGLQPMDDIHLGPKMQASIAPISDRRYTLILSAIATLILLIACINFITISLAKSMNRSREIGVRKSVGAYKRQLVSQFLMESLVIAFISLLIGLLVVWLALPLFNELAQKRLHFDFGLVNILIYVGLTLLVGFLAGFYPALVVSGFKPTKILKGEVKVGSGKQTLRIIMVAAQFIVTIFLITSTLVMRKQMNFMQERQLGFDRDQLVVVPLSVDAGNGMTQQLVDGLEKGKRLTNMLQQEISINSVAITSHDFEPGSWTEVGFLDEQGEMTNFFFNTVSANYAKTMGLQIVQGRDFEPDNESDARRSILVNEAFVKFFNLENPIGARIPNENFDDHEIIGVVKDFNFASLHLPVEPLVLAQNPRVIFSGVRNVNLNSDPTPKVIANVGAGTMQQAIAVLEQRFEEAYPGEPFDYRFVDEQLNSQYEAEQNLGKIVSTASILAILIGSMGLFALAMLTMNARSKEMSIRKVLGASNANVMVVLSKGYLWLVLVALVISIPLSYQVMSKWLDDFAYRVNIGADIYLTAGLISILIAWIAIAYHSIKMALNNPVEGLRLE